MPDRPHPRPALISNEGSRLSGGHQMQGCPYYLHPFPSLLGKLPGAGKFSRPETLPDPAKFRALGRLSPRREIFSVTADEPSPTLPNPGKRYGIP